MTNFSIWPIDKTLLGATTPGQSECWNNDNEEVLCIPQSSSPLECLISYLGHLLEGGGVLPVCRDAVSVFYSPSWLDFGQIEWDKDLWSINILFGLINVGLTRSEPCFLHGQLHIECSQISIEKVHYIFGVMVIVIGNGHGDRSSNPRWDWLHFT